MSNPEAPTGEPLENPGEEMTPEQMLSALFANMVIQNANMALMFMGKMPHPQTGQPVLDLESAQMFIDQLEMIAVKTRGNLDKDEDQLLKQSLHQLRMAFVEELRKAGYPVPEGVMPTQPPPAPPAVPAPSPAPPAPAPAPAAPPAPTLESAPDAESRKRYTKKY